MIGKFIINHTSCLSLLALWHSPMLPLIHPMFWLHSGASTTLLMLCQGTSIYHGLSSWSPSPYFPQNTGYKLWIASLQVISAMSSALLKKQSKLESLLVMLPKPTQSGKSGPSLPLAWTPTPSSMLFKTKFLSYKSSPSKFVMDIPADSHPIEAWSVEDYIWHIVQTLLHLGTTDPHLMRLEKWFLYYPYAGSLEKIQLSTKSCQAHSYEGCSSLSYVAQNSSSSESLHITVTYMLIIAFFFLLHPDKYTDSNTESSLFCFCDAQLFIGISWLNLLIESVFLFLKHILPPLHLWIKRMSKGWSHWLGL